MEYYLDKKKKKKKKPNDNVYPPTPKEKTH